MPTSRSEDLDLSNPRNYRLYLSGILIETAAVLLLMAIGWGIAFLGSLLLKK